MFEPISAEIQQEKEVHVFDTTRVATQHREFHNE
jgi:hypothetical protein